jgi:tetratricopeptide (TPR) repeat protein
VVKKIGAVGFLVIGWTACATVAPPPPSTYIESPTPSYSAELSLDERLAVEEAWTYLREDKSAKAEKVLLKLGPTNSFYSAGMGYAALLAGNLQAAEQHFLRSVRDYPDLPLGHQGLGQVYKKTGLLESAYNEYLEVLKRDPENSWARKESEAIGRMKTEALTAEAKNFAALGNLTKSKEAYLRALEYSPRLQEAHLALARIYIKEKNYQNALFHLKTANANESKNKDILQDYADALYQAGQMSKSLDAYARLLELDPQNKAAKDHADDIKNHLGVAELPSQYANIASLGAVAKEDVAALISVKFKDILDEAQPKPPVIVDITMSWAFQHIIRVATYEIMDVYSNRTFQPRKTMTRAEMAETLVHLVAFLNKRGYQVVEQIPLDRIKIADVPQENFNYQPIAQVISWQIMDLAPDRTFKPELGVPGPEAIRILDLLLSLIKSTP